MAVHTLRNPTVRDVIAELLVQARRDAAGREPRGMAYQAGAYIAAGLVLFVLTFAVNSLACWRRSSHGCSP